MAQTSKIIGWRVRQATRRLNTLQASANKVQARLAKLQKSFDDAKEAEAKIPPKPKRGPGRPRKDGKPPMSHKKDKKAGKTAKPVVKKGKPGRPAKVAVKAAVKVAVKKGKPGRPSKKPIQTETKRRGRPPKKV